MVKIIIDEEKCDGCGLCIPSCHEGALAIVNGKAKMVNESLCDGMGACIGECPRGAITLVEEKKEGCGYHAAPPPVHTPRPPAHGHGGFSCPSSRTLTFEREERGDTVENRGETPSELRQWPVQLHLVSPDAPYFKNAKILLAADCTAFAMGNFHSRYLRDHSLMIACPKLDDGLDAYVEKLARLFENANPQSIMVLMMEVPCCSGLLSLVKEAVGRSSRKVPVKAAVVSLKGDTIVEREVD